MNEQTEATLQAPQQAQAAVAAEQAKGWRFTPHAIIFFSSACIMIVELVAGRLIARHLGSSLYTWTTIIGVVLAGMSLGNWIGGRLADRWPPKKFLGWLFLLSSMLCVLSLGTNAYFGSGKAVEHLAWVLHSTPKEIGWVAKIIAAVVIIFLPPALLLGTISPATAKLALDRSRKVGSTIGSVYAWGAIGSIVSTFATGFYLIAALGATGVVLTTAMGLAVIGLVLGPWRWAHAVWVVILAAALFAAKGPIDSLRSLSSESINQRWGSVLGPRIDGLKRWADAPLERLKNLSYELELRAGERHQAPKLVEKDGRQEWVWEPDGTWDEYPFAADSNYQFVKVEELQEDDRTFRVLVLDYLIHGYVNTSDASYLRYDYELVYRDVARAYGAGKPTVSAFFIGGGAYAFQRWTLIEWPGSQVDVAEIDPMVVEANCQATGLPRQTPDSPIKTYVGDARNVVADLPADRKYDFVFGDAFSDLSVPFHLTTLEFTRQVADHLKPDGAYIVNIIDDYRFGKFLGSYTLTLQKVFKHVYVFCGSADEVPLRRETFVVAASNTPLDVSRWQFGHNTEFPGAVLGQEQMAELARKCGGRILTDDDAPVENLLAPVVASRKD